MCHTCAMCQHQRRRLPSGPFGQVKHVSCLGAVLLVRRRRSAWLGAGTGKGLIAYWVNMQAKRCHIIYYGITMCVELWPHMFAFVGPDGCTQP